MRRITLFLLFAAMTALAGLAADIEGRVVDPQGEPLMSATVRLLRQNADSTFVRGASAYLDGHFHFTGIRRGKYILETTYVGYNPQFTNIEVGNKNLDLKDVAMTEAANLLKEINVVGVKTPIKVSQDTIEFNADSYKTRPNAVVEDLLKRLPGVEIGTDGSITANGQSVTKILLDGKEFFADDPKVASKNLPVDIVDKLQVVNRKSDLARLTGVDDGEDETVINLTIKKGMKNGWFGTATAGYGSNVGDGDGFDPRYSVNFNISRFHNDNQFTLLGNLNNINELGFTDGNGNRFRRYGMGSNGITTSRAIGINFNVGKEEIFRVGGNVMYTNTDRSVRTKSDRQYLFPDSTSYNNKWEETYDTGHNIRADLRLLWNPDSFNTLEFRPNMSLNFSTTESLDSASTRAGDPLRTLVNRTYNTDNSRGNAFEFGGRLIYTHNFSRHRGRSISFMGNYRMSNTWEKERSYSRNLFYALSDMNGDGEDIYDQYMVNHTWMNNVMGRLTWTEPLGNVKNGNFLTFSYQMNYRWNNADKDVWDVRGFEPEQWLQYNDTLSNRFRNNFFSQNIRVGYKKVTKTINSEVGISLVPSTSESTNLTNPDKSIPRRSVFNIAPFVRFRYRMGDQRSIAINYRGRSSEPSLNQLQPIADYSNPLNIIQGNPDLDPTFTHWFMIRFNDFNAEKQRSIMVMAHADLVQNSIVSRTEYFSETGGQRTTYTNVNGVWNGHIMAMFSQPFSRNKAFTFNNFLDINLDRRVGYTVINNESLRNSTMSVRIRETPSLAYRPDNLEIELRPFYELQTSATTHRNDVNTTAHRYGFRLDGTYYTPWGLSVNTDLNFDATSGYSAGYDTNIWRWNVQLSYQFLKSKAATIAVKVYDLLGQVNSIQRNITDSYIEDLEYNDLTRYVMLTFTYRFNTFGNGNQPQDRNMHRMGPPPGGHGGHRH